MHMCDHSGCPAQAAYGLKVSVPPKGYGLDRAMAMMVDMHLCYNHLQEEKTDFLKNNRETFEPMLKSIIGAMHLVAPDYSRAVVEGVPLDGFEWLEYERMTAKAKGESIQ